MKSLLLVSISLWCCAALRAQIPEMPLPDLPQGEQIIYLDSLLMPVEKEEAVYFMYTWYHLGKDAWLLKSPWRKKGSKLEVSGTTPGKRGEPVALSGTFKWFTRNYSRLLAQEQFSGGRYSGQTIVYDKKGVAGAIYDYEKKWDRQPWSLYAEHYKKGELVRSAFESLDTTKGKWKTLCTQGCQVSRDFK